MYPYLFYVESSLRRGLSEYESVLFCEAFALLKGDLSAGVEVAFISDQHDGHVWVSVLAHFLEPSGQMVERVSPVRNVTISHTISKFESLT